MLSSANRFHGPRSLRYVHKNGRTVHSHICKVKYNINPRSDQPKIAVVVSKKVHKSAVGRNLIRRKFYEAIRLHLPKIKPGSEIVIMIVSGEALAMPYDEISSVVRSLLKESDLYDKS